MKYILDASTALKWVLNESDSDKAIKLREEYRRQVHEILAPDTFVVEVSHALTKAERRGIIPVGDAKTLLADVMSTRPDLEPYLSLIPRAVDLSSAMRFGVYDCLYISMAEREHCKVVTADGRLLNTFPAHTISLASLP